jgi:hypothetical protein
MANLLRSHPRIAMGRERFAWRLRKGDFTPALFERDRFCLEFSPEDSHHASLDDYYSSLHGRFDQCLYVGDKNPELHLHYARVLHTFPGCKLIYMARDPVEVATSFQRRAERTTKILKRNPHRPDRDRLWPADQGWRSAIEAWNGAVKATLALGESAQLFVADYRHLFINEDFLRRLFRFLELEPTSEVRNNWIESAARRQEIEAARAARLTPDQVDQVRASARLDDFRRLLSHAAAPTHRS